MIGVVRGCVTSGVWLMIGCVGGFGGAGSCLCHPGFVRKGSLKGVAGGVALLKLVKCWMPMLLLETGGGGGGGGGGSVVWVEDGVVSCVGVGICCACVGFAVGRGVACCCCWWSG